MPNHHSSLERTIRECFGLTQAELARYLRVSRSQLNMAERQERELPGAALTKLLTWVPLLPAPDAAEPSAPEPAALAADPITRTALERRLEDCQHEAERLRQALKPLHERAARAQRRRLALPTLQAAVPSGSAGDQERRWVEFFAAETGYLADAGGKAALLTLRLRAVEFEIAETERWLGAA